MKIILALTLVLSSSMAVAESVLDFKLCEIGYRDFMIPLISEAGSKEELKFINNNYRGVAAVSAFFIVNEVMRSKSDDFIASIKYKVNNYEGLAAEHWAVYSESERLESIMKHCLEINPKQTEVVNNMRSIGFFDPNVKDEDIMALRSLVGLALEEAE